MIRCVHIFICLTGILLPITAQFVVDIDTNFIDAELKLLSTVWDFQLTKSKQEQNADIKVYYESLCPGSRQFYTEQLTPTVVQLSQYLDVHLYPYGNAETIIHDNGTYEFHCQHGSGECYGNKLHACAFDVFVNITKAVIYNSCMMNSTQTGHGSDDEAADKCATTLDVNAEPIKQCAKGEKGNELLKYYGEESAKAKFDYVPYIKINEVLNDGDNFKEAVCAAFANPPPPCNE